MKKDKTETNVVRLNHNQDLIKRMRNGEPLWSFDSNASWFPERPKIKKDMRAVESLYGHTPTAHEGQKPENLKSEPSNVVSLLPNVSTTGRAS